MWAIPQGRVPETAHANLGVGAVLHVHIVHDPTPQCVKFGLVISLYAEHHAVAHALGTDVVVARVLDVGKARPGGVVEAVGLVPIKNATEEECIRACKLACADDFINTFPDKYNTYIEQGGTNVSGGQKQRLCIARALLKKPKILILDDSTSAVDTATDAKIRKAFAEEIPGTTKLIIAQRISSVQSADRIIVLDEGKINGFGTHEELLANNAIYRDVYESQTGGGGDFDENGGAQ